MTAARQAHVHRLRPKIECRKMSRDVIKSISKRTPRPIPRRGTPYLSMPALLLCWPHVHARTLLMTLRRNAPRAGVLALPSLPDGVPFPVLPVTGLAGAALDSLGVELCVLVQGDEVRCVACAEDVAAVPAVVFSDEEVEG